MEPKGYWLPDGYSYIGIMPNGNQQEFANRSDFLDAYKAVSEEES